MRATACAVLLALLLGACATSKAAPHGTKTGTHKRSTGVARIHTSPQPTRNVGTAKVGSHAPGRMTGSGIRTFKLQPGRHVMPIDGCGPSRTHIKPLPARQPPLRYACAP
jgi:hypothetical protein